MSAIDLLTIWKEICSCSIWHAVLSNLTFDCVVVVRWIPVCHRVSCVQWQLADYFGHHGNGSGPSYSPGGPWSVQDQLCCRQHSISAGVSRTDIRTPRQWHSSTHHSQSVGKRQSHPRTTGSRTTV